LGKNSDSEVIELNQNDPISLSLNITPTPAMPLNALKFEQEKR
jgi:hypothetical protein